MAQPARHRERSRKTLPAGDPKLGLTAQKKLESNRRWMKVQWQVNPIKTSVVLAVVVMLPLIRSKDDASRVPVTRSIATNEGRF
jgi:hypothetical protein